MHHDISDKVKKNRRIESLIQSQKGALDKYLIISKRNVMRLSEETIENIYI